MTPREEIYLEKCGRALSLQRACPHPLLHSRGRKILHMSLKGEIIINGVTFAVACLLFYVATTFPQLRFADRVGPAFWPKTILFTVIVLSGSLLLKNVIVGLRREELNQREVSAQEGEGTKRLIVAIGLSIIYGFSVPYGGFLFSIFLFQALFLLILKVKKVFVLVLFPLSLTLTLYIIFIKVLYIPLPRGAGIFLTFSRLFY